MPTPPPAPTTKPIPAPAAEPVPESIDEFDQLIESTVDKYVKLSNDLGGIVAKQVREYSHPKEPNWRLFLTRHDLLIGRRSAQGISRAEKVPSCHNQGRQAECVGIPGHSEAN